MTVAELIEELSQIDPTIEVMVPDDEFGPQPIEELLVRWKSWKHQDHVVIAP